MQKRLLKAVLCVPALIAIAGPARSEICYDPQNTTPRSTELTTGEQAQTSDQGSPDVGAQHFCPDPPFDPPPPPPPEPVVKGYIDGIVTDGAGTPHVRGWACATTLSQSIDVHLYVGGASGAGTYLGAHTASVNSGSGVANACDATGEHRFYITLTDAQRIAHAGETIYIHGISPVGGSHNLLSRSGQFAVPALPNDPPSVALTAPTDGAHKVAPAQFGLTATASDSDGIASVEFYVNGNFLIRDLTAPYAYRGWADIGVGTYQVQARARDNRGATKSSAVRTVTVDPPNVPPSVSLTAPANGASDYAPGSFTVSANASDSDGDGIVKVQFKADGDVIQTDTSAPYAYTWSGVALGDHTLQAVAHDGRDGVTASATRTVTVTEAPNIPPSVSLTAPTDGASDYAPGSFTLSASAIDPDADGIVHVRFKANGAVIHTDTTRPYSYTWNNVEIGNYTLQAVARDGRDGVTASATRSVTVTEPPNIPPDVSLTAPADGASDYQPGSFTLVADASDSDGDGIVSVEFKADGAVIHTDTTAPYSYAWSSVAIGSYTLQAVARDGRDGVTASTTRTVTVSEPLNVPPSVSLTSPADGASAYAPGWFAISANASDSDGDGIASVTFKADGVVIHEDTTAPYSFAWNNVAVGAYTLQAVARDHRDGVTASATRSVSVASPPSQGVASVTRRYVYDAHQRLCKTIEPETGATIVEYDAAGNVAWTASGQPLLSLDDCQRTNVPLAQRVIRTYDARNRLTRIDFDDNHSDTDYAYTVDGLLASVVAYNDGTPAATSYTYNRRRLQTSERLQFSGYDWTISTGYSANGHRATITYPGGSTVGYAPNALGQPTRAGLYATGVRYHPSGAIKQFTYGNGITHTLTQNLRRLPDTRCDAAGVCNDEAVLFDGYDYDANGNVAAISDGRSGHRGDRTMTYDARDRLTDVVSPMYGAAGAHYTYDALDNLKTVVVAARNHAYVYDEHNRLTNVTQGIGGPTVIGLDYDDQGNLSNKNGMVFNFDQGNRLRSVYSGDGDRLGRSWYDGHGRRVRDYTTASRYTFYGRAGRLLFSASHRKARTTDYVYLGGRLLATRDRAYTTGAITVKYHHTDALGSPVAVTDASGNEIERNEYEPYGAPVNGVVEDEVGYTGHLQDAVAGLVYMQQRYYDPLLGRFLSADPVTADPNTGANFNRYWYAANNPYGFVDPDGRMIQRMGTPFGGGCAGRSLCTRPVGPDVQLGGGQHTNEHIERSRESTENEGIAEAVGKDALEMATDPEAWKVGGISLATEVAENIKGYGSMFGEVTQCAIECAIDNVVGESSDEMTLNLGLETGLREFERRLDQAGKNSASKRVKTGRRLNLWMDAGQALVCFAGSACNED